MEEGNTSFTSVQYPITCWLFGYFRHNAEMILFDKEAAEYTLRLYKENYLLSEVGNLNGSFVLILLDEESKRVSIITDRWGSVPLYWGRKNGQLFVTDDYWQLVSDINALTFNRVALTQLLQFNYVLGTQTIIEGVEECSPHTIINIDYSQELQVSQKRYWSYQLTESSKLSEAELLESLTHSLNNTIKIYADAIKKKNWKAAVPLSGGLDSRFISWGLSKNNVPLIAYSYGTKGYGDLEIASQTADLLSIPIKKITWEDEKPFTGKRHDELVNLGGMTTTYSIGIGALAIKEECQSSCDVVVPGHSGDFIAGSHVLDYHIHAYNSRMASFSIGQVFKGISDRGIQRLFPWSSEHWEKVRNSYLGTLKINNDPSILSLTQRWTVEQRIRRYTLRECYFYRKFGYQVMLPFWDYELVDTFRTVPRKYLYNRYLYRRLMRENIFTGMDTPLGLLETPHGPIVSLKERAFSPTLAHMATRLSKAGIYRIKNRIKPSSSSKLSSNRYQYIWYHSAEFQKYFYRLFRDSPLCQELFDMNALNRLLEQAKPRFIVEPVYNLATIAHPTFSDFH
ncbi:asparagine synthase-related protein [Chloroflexota bacterium]